MPTVKPRVQVTLEPQTHEVFARLAQLQGRTRGSIIAELLDAIAPTMAQTVAILEAAESAPQQVKDGLRAVVESAHDDLLEAAGDGIKQMDFLLTALSGSGADPHVVTRGSGMGVPPSHVTAKKPRKRSNPGGPANG